MKKIFACFACSALIVVSAGSIGAQDDRAQKTVTLQSFVGTWVGTQKWADDIKSPGPAEEQEVVLTIEEFNGKLVGSLTPFFGGSDGASFGNGDLVGVRVAFRGCGGGGKGSVVQTISMSGGAGSLAGHSDRNEQGRNHPGTHRTLSLLKLPVSDV